MIKKTYIAVFMVVLRFAWNSFNIFSQLIYSKNFYSAIITDFVYSLLVDYFNLYSIQ